MHRIRLTATALLATALHGQPPRQTVRLRIPEPYPALSARLTGRAAGPEDLRRLTVRQACDPMLDFGQVKAGWPESECAAPNAACPGIFFD